MEGKLTATFRVDKDGELRGWFGGKHTTYKIQLTVEGLPDGIDTVTYLLHPSYGDERVRAVSVGVPGFAESITSYGDFFITVTGEGTRPANREWFAVAFVTKLSDALKAGHPKLGRTPAITQAMNEIAKH